MTSTLKMSSQSAYLYLTIALVLATPFFVVFGWLSDKIGRKWIMISGFVLSAACFSPIFQGIAQYGNPALKDFRTSTKVIIEGGDCSEDQSFIGQLFQPKATKPCTRARSYLSSNSVPYSVQSASGELRLVIGDTVLPGFDEAATQAVLLKQGMPITADPARVNGPMVVALLFALIFLATMVYGPLGAFLVEQFPTKVRYSGVSVSLQFGNGWIGGFAPFIATALAVSSGDIFHGLMYTIIVALVSAIVGSLFIRDNHHATLNAPTLPKAHPNPNSTTR